MFLDLDHVNYIAVYGKVRELSEFIKNILLCVPKMNGVLTGSGWPILFFLTANGYADILESRVANIKLIIILFILNNI